MAQVAAIAYQTIQAERPRRRSPLPRQVGLAAGTVAFDGVACCFAAQALNGGQDSTLIWTVLFLAVLAGGEIGLDFYRDRNLHTWRILAWIISAFVVLLGVLRFWFLAVIGADDLVAAFTGAVLFTVVTAGFMTVGYRTLRAAETPQAWRARRAATRHSGRTNGLGCGQAGRRRSRPAHRCLPQAHQEGGAEDLRGRAAAGRGVRGARAPVRKVPLR